MNESARYVLEVAGLLSEADVCPEDQDLHVEDTLWIGRAAGLLFRGRVDQAVEIARGVADRWQLPVDPPGE